MNTLGPMPGDREAAMTTIHCRTWQLIDAERRALAGERS